MSGRCKCCDSLLTGLVSKLRNGEEEPLCNDCRDVALHPDDLNVDEHQWEYDTEGIKRIIDYDDFRNQ